MYYPNRRPRHFSHYVLPDGTLVRVISYRYNASKEFVTRVTSNSRDRLEFLDGWFKANAVYVGQMERQF